MKYSERRFVLTTKNRKNINTTLDVSLYSEIRHLAIEKGVNANDLIEQGMKLILESSGKKRKVGHEKNEDYSHN